MFGDEISKTFDWIMLPRTGNLPDKSFFPLYKRNHIKFVIFRQAIFGLWEAVSKKYKFYVFSFILWKETFNRLVSGPR